MKKTVIAILIIVIALMLSTIGCAKVTVTSGVLKAKSIGDTVFINFVFSGVPKAVDNGNVYLNGSLVGSINGTGNICFEDVEPNTVFKLTTATQTLSTIIVHR